MATSETLLRLAQHETVTVVVTMDEFGDISADSFVFSVRETYGDNELIIQESTAGGGIVITTAGGPAAYGVVTITISNAVNGGTGELTPGAAYSWDLWRTTVGAEARLNVGPLIVDTQYRLTPA